MNTVRRVLMCRPTYFRVEYIINPHMKPDSVDSARAHRQWDMLKATLESLDITVEVIEQQQDVPDMVFATDQGIVKDGSVLLANFRHIQRKPERHYYRNWFKQHGFKLRALSNVFSFEGGDSLFFGTYLVVGTGFRASQESCEELGRKLAVDVIPLKLVDPRYYHLDTCFLPIDEATAFYYPAAFAADSIATLKRIVPNLIDFTPSEVEQFAANSFVSGNNIVVQKTPDSFQTKLTKLGKIVHEVDVSEFNKSGGGIHCLINTLEMEKA